MLSETDWKDVKAEVARQDAKWGSQIDVPLGTGPDRIFPTDQGMYPEMGDCTFETLAKAAKEDTDRAFKAGEGSWVLILLEEVFEAFAEEGGQLGGEALEEELLQVASVALQMRVAARHHRVMAEMRKAEVDRILLYGTFHPCGHRNYGTREKPASVHYDCIDCRQYYCDACNYDRHQCGGCGEPYRHGEGPHKDGKWCIDLPENEDYREAEV